MKQGINDGTNVFDKAVNGVLEIETETASGSGVLIDRYGYALTNAHVVTENGIPNKEIIVRVADEKVSASILELGDDAIDVEDLALIRLSRVPSQATPLALGDFNDVKTGEEIFIIGNSKGEGTCITRGIVSDRLRDGMMMTDASTNSGNSGGPVLNKNGYVIGIQQSHHIEAVGMKYAIPIDTVKQFLLKKCNYNIYEDNAFFLNNDSLEKESQTVPGEMNNTSSTDDEKPRKTPRFCSACGNALSENAGYCAICGTKVSSQTTENQSQRKTVFDGEIHKCPHCGELLKAFETICPTCKFELRGTKGSSAIKNLAEKLENATSEKQRIIIIKNFPIPNTKEDIFEFMLLASSNFDASYYATHLHEEDISDAWLSKVEQCYEKAKLTFTNQNDLDNIKRIYDKIISDAESCKIAEEKKIAQKEKHEIKKEKQKRNKDRNAVIIGLCCMFVPIIIINIMWFVFGGGINTNPDAIKVGISYEDVEGQYYEDVIEIFEKNGFTNIEAREDGWNLLHKSGTVKSVTIDGKEEFYSFSKFSKDAKVIILYYK